MKQNKATALKVVSLIVMLGGFVLNAATSWVEHEQMKEEVKEEVSKQLAEKSEKED